jgi:hypothetical protein
MRSEVATHVCLPEPKLAFHPDRSSDREIHPLRGLLRFVEIHRAGPRVDSAQARTRPG